MVDNSGHDVLFNRILDVTSCVHVLLKSFAIYVIAWHTPQNLRHYSYFILNAMFWNFLISFQYTLVHIYPLYPALCFRLDGFVGHFIDSEVFGQSMFILMFFLVIECGFALLLPFPYRYIVFVHPKMAARISPTHVFALCAGVHVLFALIYFPIAIGWMVSYDDYPNKAELPERSFVFCAYPNGVQKTAIIVASLTGATVFIMIIVVSSVLFLQKVKKLEQRIVHDDTLVLQKKVFANLLMLTAIALFFAGLPLSIFLCAALFAHTPHNQEISMYCIAILSIHGSISAIAYLVSFKTYRDAVKRIFSNLLDQLTGPKNKVHSVAIMTSQK